MDPTDVTIGIKHFVIIRTKHYVTTVTSTEYQRIDFELGKTVLFQGLQLL